MLLLTFTNNVFLILEEYMGYDALSSIEAVRKRPGMYIGETKNPDHMATEAVDNALDELANNFATQLNIFIDTDNNAFWVSDNGRGLDVYEDMELADGRLEDSIVALCTITHTGSKFDTDDYSTLIGMHGVGLVAINALSDWLVIRTKDKKDPRFLYQYYFKDSELVEKKRVEESSNYSTTVGFSPSKKYFTSTKFNEKFFAERLLLVQAKYPNASILFNNEEIPKITFTDFVRGKLNLNGEKAFSLSYEATKSRKLKGAKIHVVATVVESPDTLMLGEVNLRLCEGTFLNSFATVLKKKISEKIDKKFKNVTQTQLLTGLRVFISLTVPEPTFDSQTKVRMTLQVKKQLIDTMADQIESFVAQNEIIKQIERNLEKKFFSKITKTAKRYKKQISAENKLKDCIKIPGDVLYILEGDSALGTLKQIRDTMKEAIFPLKGKVMNVESHSLERISKNKEIKYLLEALGPKGKRRYHEVKIIADADVDGAHITVLVLLLLQRYADDLIKDGKVSVIIPPLHGASKGKKFFPIYTENQLSKYKSENYTIQRFKGLGEMSPAKLKPIIRSGFEYKVTWPENDRTLQHIISVVTDTSIKRAIMNNEKCTFDNIIQTVIENLKTKFNQTQEAI